MTTSELSAANYAAYPKIKFKPNMIILILHVLIGFVGANFFGLSAVLPDYKSVLIPVGIVLFIIANLGASFSGKHFPSAKLRVSYHGAKMLNMFLITTLLSIAFFTFLLFANKVDVRFKSILPYFLIPFFAELIYFWNGIACVYLCSKQLGIKYRAIGLIVGWMPLINLIVLSKIIRVTENEVVTECEKTALNKARSGEQICATKYPLLMVHGVFFRDFEKFNDWGRIPGELETNGSKIYYGNHQSALSIEDSAAELAARIKEIVEETGCEKVNIIAHSKGGLDTRYAISKLGVSPYVASLTTINTPHRGCEFADFLLSKAGDAFKDTVASAYNAGARKLGDANPDFIAAVSNLTASFCKDFNDSLADFDFKAAGIYTQSIGSSMLKSTGGHFPLNMSYRFVKRFDGKNDGLVGENSFSWGEKFTFVEPERDLGISHGDMIDLNRENIEGFDVREFFVQLVADLKKKGL